MGWRGQLKEQVANLAFPQPKWSEMRRMTKQTTCSYRPSLSFLHDRKGTVSQASELNIQLKEESDAKRIKRVWHEAGKAFHSSTFKRAQKKEENVVYLCAKVWQHLSPGKSSLHDRQAQTWHYTEQQDKRPHKFYTISSSFTALCLLL